MRRLVLSASLLLLATIALAAEPTSYRVYPAGTTPPDSRLAKYKTLNDYFPFAPPASKEAWDARRQELREQILTATGLWPVPPSEPIEPVIHGAIDKGDYTIEKVYFQSFPGHYVCGNLYRPKGKEGKKPGVLFAHGHWANGRMHDAGEKAATKEVEQGAEKTKESARFLLQACAVGMARLGCVVFHYDMVGNADSKQISHGAGFRDVAAELRCQSAMGLQTYNSMCALSFLSKLPDVDAKRIGMTGASGGGTQTFILCAIDDRPAVAFPAVMVSTAMQGGCVCENCTGLRVGTGNVEMAGLFAPKPLGMSGANDWTIDIEKKGLPELKQLYALLGAEDKVMAKCYPQFGHNYNQVSRELMYGWFNRHLGLGLTEPIQEKPFVPLQPKELSVFDAEHPRPTGKENVEEVRQAWTALAEKQMAALTPKDSRSLKEFQKVVGAALRSAVADKLPAKTEVAVESMGNMRSEDGAAIEAVVLGRVGAGEKVPAFFVTASAKDHKGTVVVWVHPKGKESLFKGGKLIPAARKILDGNNAILAPDVLLTGEFAGAKAPTVNKDYAGYTYGYNRTLLGNRVHDILTAVAFAKGRPGTKQVHLVGWESAGPWVVLARGLTGDAVTRTAADANEFRFENIKAMDDEMLLPGAVKYGGLPAYAALAAPGELYLHHHQGTSSGKLTKGAYTAAGAPDNLVRNPKKVADEEIVAWLLR